MKVYTSGEIAAIAGVTPITLNKWVERHTFGIGPSIRGGGGRGNHRVWDEADVRGAMLAGALHKAGLRLSVTGLILDELANKFQATANEAAAQCHWWGGIYITIGPDSVSAGVVRQLADSERPHELVVTLPPLEADTEAVT